MPEAQPDHAQAIQDLLDHIEDELTQSYDITDSAATHSQNRFVPIGRLETWLRLNSFDRMSRILKAVFGDQPRQVRPLDVAETCCRVFCILARIGQTRFIGSFTPHHNLWDSKLPYSDSEHPPPHFPTDPAHPDFYKRFYEEQWKFYAPKLDKRMGVRFDRPCILPFLSLDRSGGGSTSTVYRAVVHENHDDLSPLTTPNHCYAIKSYRRRTAQRDYEKESEAFSRITESGLRITPGIIGFYASFEYGGSFNLLLEYADQGTLENFFSRSRPESGPDIIAFWKSIFEVIKGIWWVHDHHLPTEGSKEALLEQGWHQDLKPANILVLTSDAPATYKGFSFKIADFGLSHFKTIMEGRGDALALDTAGTRTYGAPETYSRSSYTESKRHNWIKRGVDIWSLGCIFSEIATWVVKGVDGLRDYRRGRALAIGRIQGFRWSDCFHDGQKRLGFIDEHHMKLRRELDAYDRMTARVLEYMVDDMLRANIQSRPSAEQLDGKAESAAFNARNSLQTVSRGLSDGMADRSLNFRDPPPVSSHPPIGRPHAQSQPLQRGYIFSGDRIQDSPSGTMSLPIDAMRYPSPPETPTRQPRPSETMHGLGLSEQAMQGTSVLGSGVIVQTPPTTGVEPLIDSTRPVSDPVLPTELPVRPPVTSSPPPIPATLVECPFGCGMHMKADRLERHKSSCEEYEKWQKPPADLPSPSREPPPVPGPSKEAKADVAEVKGLVPYCTVKQAEEYHESNQRRDRSARLPDHDYILAQLENRDHVFMIDDSETMKKYWNRVRDLATTLTYLVKGTDKDGVDLFFLSSDRLRNFSSATQIYKSIHEHRKYTWGTNINDRLNEDLVAYARKIESPNRQSTGLFRARTTSSTTGQSPKKRSIYIFTDGILRSGQKAQGHPAITMIVEKLLKAGFNKGHLGIQLISFGDDETGIDRLETLDKLNPGLDVVDHEPSTGNVYKMLLGSINPVFDNDPDPDDAAAGASR